MNYLVLQRYESEILLDFFIVDEITDRYKPYFFYRKSSYKEYNWKSGWSCLYEGIIANSDSWTCTPTTVSTPEEVVSNHPELFI